METYLLKHIAKYVLLLLFFAGLLSFGKVARAQTVTFGNLTGGLTSTMTAGDQQRPLLGFSVNVSGGSVTFSSFTFDSGNSTANQMIANGTLYRYPSGTTSYSAGTGTAVGNVSIGTSVITISNLTETISNGTNNYFFVADAINTSASYFQLIVSYGNTFAIDNTSTSYPAHFSANQGYNYATGIAYPLVVNNAMGGLASTSTVLTSASTNAAMFGFSLATSTGTKSVTQIYINSSMSTVANYFSNFRMFTTGTGTSFTSVGSATAVPGTFTLSGGYVKFVPTSSISATTTAQYYWLVANVALTGTLPVSPQFFFTAGQSNTAFTASGNYNTFTCNGGTYNINSAAVAMTSEQNGMAAATVYPGMTGLAVFGFGLSSSNGTSSITQMNINSSNGSLSTYYGNFKLYFNSANSYTTGTPTLLGTGTVSGSSINFTGFPAQTINGIAKFYFIVADCIYAGAGTNSTAFNFTSGQSSSALIQSSPTSAYNTFSIAGNTFNITQPSVSFSSNTTGVTAAGPLTYGQTYPIYGFDMAVTGTAVLNSIVISNNATGTVSNFFGNAKLYRNSTNNYATGTKTLVGTATINATNITITAINDAVSNTTGTYYLVVDDIYYATSGAFQGYMSSATYGVTSTPGNYENNYSFVLPTPTYTLTGNNSVSNGITQGALQYGQTGIVLFGFKMDVTGTTDITQMVIASTGVSSNYFSNGILYRSTNPNFSVGTSTLVNTGTISWQTNYVSIPVNENFSTYPAATTYYYFLVGDYTNNNASTSGTLQYGFSTSQSPATFSLSTGGTISPSNVTNGQVFNVGLTYDWVGISSTAYNTTTNYRNLNNGGVSSVPGTYDQLRVGVVAYQSSFFQPTIPAGINIASLTIGPNNTPAITISSGTLTVSGNVTVNGSASPTFSGGTLAVGTNFTNNGTNFTQGSTNITVAGTLNNAGTFTQNSTGTVTAATLSNTGTYTHSGTGGLSVTGAMTNDGAYTQTNSGSLTVGGLLTNSATKTITLHSSTTTLNGSVSNAGVIAGSTGAIDVNGATFDNSGTFTAGSSTNTFACTTFTNTGTFTAGNNSINFDLAGNQPSLSTATPITFGNLNFSGGSTKTISSGSFVISNTGSLTMSGSTTLNANGNLTLNSDATGSGRIAVIPSGASITGNVNVQRYFTGGTTTTRGYRLLSSPVNSTGTSTGGSSATFTMSNLTNLFTGGPLGTSGGFSVTNTGTSTIFLYREDTAPLATGGVATSFNNGNYRGFGALNVTPFPVLQTGSAYSLYAGDGVMLYYAGSNVGTNFATVKTPDNALAVYQGTLNQGSIAVKLWYNSSVNFTYTGSNTATGFALVGNPYASTIDLNTFSRTTGTAGVYSPGSGSSSGLTGTFYEYNYVTKNFDTYQAFQATGTGPAAGTGTGSATRYVASGQGFFVKAYAANANLTFNEAAKYTGQPATLLMGLPVAGNVPQLLKVKFSQDAINNQDVAILFESAATNGYDLEYEADHVGGIGNVVSLSSFAQNSGQPLSINHMHSIDSLTRIRLNLTGTTTGVDTLSASGIESLDPRYDIYLVDHYKKDSTILSPGSKYTFSIITADTTTYGSTRFELACHKKASLANYKLLSFTAAKVSGGLQLANSGILLTWKVQNEDKFTGFTIQRADGSLQFLSLYSLQSDGSGTYTYTDHSPLAGVNKYRLMQDGAFDKISYSDIVTVDPDINTTSTNTISLYPNPVVNQLQISIGNNPPGMVHLTIMNAGSGTVMSGMDISSSNIQQNVSSLSTGSYIVEVSDVITKRVIGRKKFIKL